MTSPEVLTYITYSTSRTRLPAFTSTECCNRLQSHTWRAGRKFSRHLTSQEHFSLMATTSFSEEDLLCPQCTEVYYFPVLLKCGHNFCRVCLQKFWECKGCRECPVCHTVSAPARPPINLALKIAVDEYQLQQKSKDQDVCRLHNEKLKLFCQNDEEPICLVCHTSRQHKVHECCPVEEAAQQKKVKIETVRITEGLLHRHCNTRHTISLLWEQRCAAAAAAAAVVIVFFRRRFNSTVTVNTVTTAVVECNQVHLLKYSTTLLEYFHFLLLYTSTPQHLRGNIVLFTPLHVF